MRHFRTPRLTCADSDSTNKLLSPAAAPHHQSQVRLLDQLVHCALQAATKAKKARQKGQVGGSSCVNRYEIYDINIILTLSYETVANYCVTPPTVVHSESPKQMQGNTKSHYPPGIRHIAKAALHQCRE